VAFWQGCFYPGANDNASGVAFLLTLAEHYARPENPVILLDRILQVIDLNMVADNGNSLFVETGPEREETLLLFREINSRLNL
jgi:hypothetical protein